MPRLINWSLVANPANWIVVYAMVAFFVLALTLIDPLLIDRQAQGEKP